MDLANKKVTVIGLSESGFSAAKLLKRLKARVRISELRDDRYVRSRLKILEGIPCELGGHTKRFISESDLLVVSPGVPPDTELFSWTRQAGIPVIGELELGAMFCRAPIIAVTGTNGKSTTAALIHHILRANNIDSFLLGNIGTPLSENALDMPGEAAAVVEVSSFQLESIKTFRPKIALLLNICQDHLDRYHTMDEYTKAKLRIFENQESSDYAILDHDDPALRAIGENVRPHALYFSGAGKVKGGYPEGDRLLADWGNGARELCRRGDIKLPGLHNVKNVLAAALSVTLINKQAEIAAPIRNFAGLKHRCEIVARTAGTTFVDDSKSTTVSSTVMALESFAGKKVVLIAGGRDKGSDYSPLRNQLQKIKHIVLLGEARNKIRDVLKGVDVPVQDAATMRDAVTAADGAAEEGDIVLLSPMCSSFDMFTDYRERGEAFRDAIFERMRAQGATY